MSIIITRHFGNDAAAPAGRASNPARRDLCRLAGAGITLDDPWALTE
jgi:hypothetical protein